MTAQAGGQALSSPASHSMFFIVDRGYAAIDSRLQTTPTSMQTASSPVYLILGLF